MITKCCMTYSVYVISSQDSRGNIICGPAGGLLTSFSPGHLSAVLQLRLMACSDYAVLRGHRRSAHCPAPGLWALQCLHHRRICCFLVNLNGIQDNIFHIFWVHWISILACWAETPVSIQYTISASKTKTLLTMWVGAEGSRFTEIALPCSRQSVSWLVTAAAYLSGSRFTPIPGKPSWPQLSEWWRRVMGTF